MLPSCIRSCKDGIGVVRRRAEHASKTAFCGANDSLDRASANVSLERRLSGRPQEALPRLDSPEGGRSPGALGQTVNQLVTGVERAVVREQRERSQQSPRRRIIDTYCDVKGNRSPLPSYFGAGKTTTFCSTFVASTRLPKRLQQALSSPFSWHIRHRSTNSHGVVDIAQVDQGQATARLTRLKKPLRRTTRLPLGVKRQCPGATSPSTRGRTNRRDVGMVATLECPRTPGRSYSFRTHRPCPAQVAIRTVGVRPHTSESPTSRQSKPSTATHIVSTRP